MRCMYRPAGFMHRVMAALILIAQAIGYIQVLVTGATYTTSYRIQSTLMPLWAYATVLGICGLLLLRTVNHRRTWYARSIAGAGFVIQGLIAWTFYLSGGFTAFWWGLVVMWALGVESIWINSWDE